MKVRTIAEMGNPEESILGVRSTTDRSLSASQLETWLACEQRWTYKYIDGLEKKTKHTYLDLGSFVHELMAAAFLEDDAYAIVNMPLPPNEDLQDIFRQAQRIAYRAYLNFPKEYKLAYIEGKPAVEIYIETDIPGWKSFRGFIDLVVVDKYTGKYWLVDYKVRKSFTTPDQEVVNIQMPAYQHMLTQNGYPTVGSITYQISDKLPSAPKITAKGQVSRAKIKTDVATYKQAIIENGENPDDYSDVLFRLAETKFQLPLRKYRSDIEVKNTWEHIIIPTAERIKVFAESETAMPLRTWNRRECGFCSFLEPCTEEIKGRDTTWLISENYTTKAQRKNHGY